MTTLSDDKRAAILAYLGISGVGMSNADLEKEFWDTFSGVSGGSSDGVFMQRIRTGGIYHGMGGGRASGVINSGVLYYSPFLIDIDATFDRVGFQVSTAGSAASTADFGIYSDNGFYQPDALVNSVTGVLVDTTGYKESTVSWSLTAGMYWLGIMGSATFQAHCLTNLSLPLKLNSAPQLMTQFPHVGYYQTRTYVSGLPATAVPNTSDLASSGVAFVMRSV